MLPFRLTAFANLGLPLLHCTLRVPSNKANQVELMMKSIKLLATLIPLIGKCRYVLIQ